jgi:hypothetical protein
MYFCELAMGERIVAKEPSVWSILELLHGAEPNWRGLGM